MYKWVWDEKYSKKEVNRKLENSIKKLSKGRKIVADEDDHGGMAINTHIMPLSGFKKVKMTEKEIEQQMEEREKAKEQMQKQREQYLKEHPPIPIQLDQLVEIVQSIEQSTQQETPNFAIIYEKIEKIKDDYLNQNE